MAFRTSDAALSTEKEPSSSDMDMQLERRAAPIDPIPTAHGQRDIHASGIDAPELHPDRARSETDRLLDRLHRAALNDDGREMHAVGRDYLRSPNGQAWPQDVQEYGQAAQAREQQAAWEAQHLQQAAEQMRSEERRVVQACVRTGRSRLSTYY